MDIIAWTIMILVVGWVFWKWVWPKADVNITALTEAMKVKKEELKDVADVNQNGKIDVADAKEVVKKAVTTRAKRVTTKTTRVKK